ncbi:hypothetical protein DMB91_07200 [Campylobacter sp. MIT 97-5078]|nr:hypothetical protein LR59_11000 [Campylobacter sp. MIT 97-5078]KGI56806.1 hypothetical protein LR59_04805 [Campylobacter sp. MIT 97-5078]TQR25582.1 hypothetical protein DMB91_07200 [Campylobacter sp. MIT 97-5078]
MAKKSPYGLLILKDKKMINNTNALIANLSTFEMCAILFFIAVSFYIINQNMKEKEETEKKQR